MGEARLLLELAGEAALLLWGLHMVQSGVQRAFGSRLRQALGIALGGPGRAFCVSPLRVGGGAVKKRPARSHMPVRRRMGHFTSDPPLYIL